jgi:hypothetical protein
MFLMERRKYDVDKANPNKNLYTESVIGQPKSYQKHRVYPKIWGVGYVVTGM